MANRVLIVDDSRAFRNLISFLLDREDFEIKDAESGKAALDLLMEDNSFDLVITDIVMPCGDGFALIDAMKRCETLKDIPVLVLSTAGFPDFVERAKNAGAIGWIVKPFEPKKFMPLIEACIKKNQELRESKKKEIES